MAAPITTINPRGINTTGDYVVNSISSTGNVTAGNIRTDHLLHANGDPYVFTSNAAGTNTQVQFNDANNFAGSANLTFNKTTGTLTADFFVGNGSQLTGLPASYTDTNANSAIDARVTKSFIDNLNVDADTLDGLSSLDFATAAQGTKADTALQPSALTGYATELFVGNTVANLVNSAPALLDTLGELANAIGNDASFTTTITNQLANKANSADLSTVALTGNYADLNNKPTLFDGTYANLTGKPSLFDGEYASLANKPSLFSGSYLDLTNTPTLFDGTYANLTGKPTLGTAAATNANAYATAAQGLLADSAIQTGANISVFTNDSGYLVAANLSGYATESYVGTQISNLVDAAPTTLNTLNELAAALGDDPSFATSIATSIGNKLSTSDFTSTADTWLGTKSTTNLAEGTNLYYTTTRANSAIDARVTKTFVDNLSVVANVANVAYSVAVANVTGIGNIATINKDGNASNILYGNGVFASAPVTYANSNVESYLPTYTGNLTPGNIIISSDNLKLSGGTANYVLSTDGTGNLSWVQQASGGTSSGGGESTVTSVDTFTGNGVDTVFTLSVAPQNINQTFINYNGAWQLRSAYTLSGQEVTFSEAPADGSVIEVTTQMNVTSGSGNLTVRTYTADGVQTTYTVSAGVNATNILVTENGLLQTPAVDYTVSGTTLTFTQAPGYGVKIQIRELGVAVATITPVGSNTQVIFNDAGSFGNSSQFTFNKSSNALSVGNLSVTSYVTGNLVPNANVTYNLGSSDHRWKDLYLSGNTIDLAGAKIKSDPTTGSIAFVPPATVNAPNPTALVISPSGAISTSVTTNGVLAANAFSSAIVTGTVSSPRYISMVKTGNITAPSSSTRYYPPSNVQIRNVIATLDTPATDSFEFSIFKNGSNVGNFSMTANTHKLDSTSANITMTGSDYLIITVTSGTGAADLRVDLEYTVV